MPDSFKIDFQAHGPVNGGDVVVFVGDDLKPAPAVAKQLGAKTLGLIEKVAEIERFKGKPQSAMSIAAPASLAADRLIVVGVGGEGDRAKLDFV